MREQVLFLGIILLSIFILLVVVKTVYFFKATRKRTLKRWLFFSKFDIIESSSRRIENIKNRQNVFSIVIIVYAVFAALLFYLSINDMIFF